MKAAGYTESEGYQLRSIPPGDGYDEKAVISAPFLGNLIWGDFEYIGNRGEMPLLSETENTSSVSHFFEDRRQRSDQRSSMSPVLSDNVRNGVAGCLYNVTIPNIDNWRRFGVPPDFGASSIRSANDPHIGQKVVLNLMDGLLAQYAGGPQSQPGYAFRSPRFTRARIRSRSMPSRCASSRSGGRGGRCRRSKSLGAHVQVAQEYGLGNADFSRIVIRDVGP